MFFEGFNEVFFNNRVSHSIRVRFVDPKMLENKDLPPADASWRILLNEIWVDKTYARSESISCILLLHEMAHAALQGTYVGHPSKNPGHGMIYQAELYRLFMAGAYDDLL